MTVDHGPLGSPSPSGPKGLLGDLAERVATVTAAIIGVAVALSIVRPVHPFLAQWLIWAVLFYIVAYLFNRSSSRLGRRARPFGFAALLLVAFGLGILQFWEVSTSRKHKEVLSEFEIKMRQLRWIGYEPSSFNPYTNSFGTLERTRAELRTLRELGFTGVITFSAENILSRIPAMATEEDFRGVIMGVYDVGDRAELDAAIAAADYVDAYCVGHMFTDTNFSDQQVLRAIQHLQRQTNKPVTTTLRPNGYKAFPELSNAIDWFFPDIHGNWYGSASAKTTLDQTKVLISAVSELQQAFPDKPILLKMISFPSGEVPGASPEEQYRFFRGVVEYMKSSMGFPERIYPSYFSGLDLGWKNPTEGWPAGERFLGFVDVELQPKTAEIAERKVRVADALMWSRASISDESAIAGR